ncbi:MAG: site-2 protease family protein [Gemmatimonadota bacterium]|nr:site-2 protease family protein [Gemmatimonadota bacterium]MDH5283421.1 site-2 protease family protein [Gemmatimonadota bacterium]
MDQITACFSTWRILRTGSREIVEGVVRPAHRGPSPELARRLAAWPHTHYWVGPDRAELVLVHPTRPHPGEPWPLLGALLALTVVCTLGAGATLAGSYVAPAHGGFLGLVSGALAFLPDFLTGPPRLMLSGWTFALPLLGILLVHELGHYFAARRYGIDASPPFFLPIPPTLSPIGSLGAFLKLRSPVVDRRQLLDVGAAGPLAGFVVALGVLAWGYSTSTPLPAWFGFQGAYVEVGGTIYGLGDSLLTHFFQEWFHPDERAIRLSLPAFAGWAGALITGLNLLPLSQLDGGHIAYGLAGRRQAPLAILTVAALLYLAKFWPAWLVWVGLTLLVGGGRWAHPSVVCPERAIPRSRRLVGLLAAVVLALTFVPVPFRP